MQRLTDPRWSLLLAAVLAGAVLIACQHEMKRTPAPTTSAQQAPFAVPGDPDSSDRQRDTGGKVDVEAGPGERSADPPPVVWEQKELDPQETARQVEEEDAVPLCSVLDSVSIGDREGRPVFRLHVGGVEPIEFIATGELEKALSFWSHEDYTQVPGQGRKGGYEWYKLLFFSRGCGLVSLDQFVDTQSSLGSNYYRLEIFIGLYAVGDDVVLMFRHMELSGGRR